MRPRCSLHHSPSSPSPPRSICAPPPGGLELDVLVPAATAACGPALVGGAVPVVDAEQEEPRLLTHAVVRVQPAVEYALLDLVDCERQPARDGVEE